ncbi:hypothetical protein ACM26V_06955 [Salipaludibacillus sp. HK11]|uniref:hypothetical protein n=1 Tax=Salipaludibacillus sp. HK11 TaxID=3394320 RepID=UPI0039FD7F75
MKRIWVIVIGLFFLSACSTDETRGTTYFFEEEEDEENEWLLPNSYQVTLDETFEMISKYQRGRTPEQMYFWHEPSAKDYSFELDTVTEDVEEHVPTIEIKPINKFVYTLTHAGEASYFTEDFTDEEVEEIMAGIEKTIEEDSEEQVEEIKERFVEIEGSDAIVYTTEDYDLEPFKYMVQSETEQGVIRYKFIGEVEDDYLRATLTIPRDKNDELFENMLASLQTITYNKNDFVDNPVVDNPTSLAYEHSENLKGGYPRVGYSFDIPETATFRHSFPVFHTYRYTFATIYEKTIEKEHFSLNSSDLVIRVEKKEHAPNREEEIRHRALGEFRAFQHDQARIINYLHEDEEFDTGVFTTAVRVEFDGYEEYWFLKESDGHVYEVSFDIAFEAPEYDEFLDSYLNVIRTFELKGLED